MAGIESKDGRSPPYVLPVIYERRLPHLQPPGRLYFVTWTLAGVIPVSKRITGFTSDGRLFAVRDRMLDNTKIGPLWLQSIELGEVTKETLLAGEQRGAYQLGAWVIMPNHVHILITPHYPLWEVMRDIKSGSARLCNKFLGRAGKPFWQREYYDRVVRTGLEEANITRYIEQNPVHAGLCRSPNCWNLSSAHKL